MTLVENDIEREARLRTQRSPAKDPVYDTTPHQPSIAARIDRNSPYLAGADIAAILVAAFMTLAPLAVAAYGVRI
jgi:hypothetical protein